MAGRAARIMVGAALLVLTGCLPSPPNNTKNEPAVSAEAALPAARAVKRNPPAAPTPTTVASPPTTTAPPATAPPATAPPATTTTTKVPATVPATVPPATVPTTPTTAPPATVPTTPTTVPVSPTPPVDNVAFSTALAGLDRSGASIPETAYPVPNNAVVMSSSGDDANGGSITAPVRTINRAVALVPAGGTIVMRGGEYRDWLNASGSYRISSKGFTLQAYPGEQPWFNGADVVTTSQWSKRADRWEIDWATPSFCDGRYYSASPLRGSGGQTSSGPCSHQDNVADPAHPVAGDPQMVFVDGERLEQVAELSSVSATSFHYDWTNRVLTIGANPAGRKVEVTARPVALILGNQQEYAIKGIGFRRYGSNEYNNLTTAAVYLGAKSAIVENAAFVDNAGQGLFLSNPKPGSSVRRSVFVDNGFNGLGANGGSKSGVRNDLVLEANVFSRNNVEEFGRGCSASCSAAGVKLAHMVGFTARQNLFQHNRSEAMGFWCDLDCSDGVMVGNVARGNGKHGIYYEVSDTGIIASNVTSGNGQIGIAVSSSNTKIYNNTVVVDTTKSAKAQGVWVYDDQRVRGVDGWTNVGPNTQNVELRNNVLSGNAGLLVKAVNGSGSASINTVATQYFSGFDNNSLVHGGGDVYNWAHTSTSSGGSYHRTPASFSALTGWERSTTLFPLSVPAFVDPDAGDYRLLPNSAVIAGGAALPADVAAVLGVPSGSVPGRGAFNSLVPRP